jgi:hypothetical protein
METPMNATRYTPVAENPRLALERKLAALLGNGTDDTPAKELAALVRETEDAIFAAEEEASLAKEAALDPTQCPDPAAARARMEDTALGAGRLRTLHARLLARHAEVAAAERVAEWKAAAAKMKDERDDLVLDFDEHYDGLVAQLVDLFVRMVALEDKLSRLLESRPSGVKLRLDGSELMARGLEAFSRATPSLLQLVQLYDRNGKRVWPPVVPRDMSLFDPGRYADPRASADWWKYKDLAAEQARAESARVGEYYEQQAKEREERERKQ